MPLVHELVFSNLVNSVQISVCATYCVVNIVRSSSLLFLYDSLQLVCIIGENSFLKFTVGREMA